MAKPIMDSITQWSPEYERVWENDRINGDPNRVTQQEAEYSDSAGPNAHTCRGCVYFQPQTSSGLGTCAKVQGVISELGYSKLYADALTGVIDNKEKNDAEPVRD